MKMFNLCDAQSNRFIGMGNGEDIVDAIASCTAIVSILDIQSRCFLVSQADAKDDFSKVAILFAGQNKIETCMYKGESLDQVMQYAKSLPGRILLVCTPTCAVFGPELCMPIDIEPAIRHKLSLVGMV